MSAEEISVCVLDRPRHADIIAALREAGARVHLITDGDVAGVINCTEPGNRRSICTSARAARRRACWRRRR